MSTDPWRGAGRYRHGQNGQFAELCERFAPPLRDMVSRQPAGGAGAEVALYGPVTESARADEAAARPDHRQSPGDPERGELTIAIDLAGEQHWITGIQFLPAGAAEPTAPWSRRRTPIRPRPPRPTSPSATAASRPASPACGARPARKDTSRPSSCSPAQAARPDGPSAVSR